VKFSGITICVRWTRRILERVIFGIQKYLVVFFVQWFTTVLLHSSLHVCVCGTNKSELQMGVRIAVGLHMCLLAYLRNSQSGDKCTLTKTKTDDIGFKIRKEFLSFFQIGLEPTPNRDILWTSPTRSYTHTLRYNCRKQGTYTNLSDLYCTTK